MRESRPVVNEWNADAARDLDNQVRDLKQRIAERAKKLKQQANTPEPRPLKFDRDGVANVMGGSRRQSRPMPSWKRR